MSIKDRRGFTLIELLVTISIVAVLAAMCIGGWRSAVARAQGVQCLGNLSGMGRASLAYAAENNMTFPATTHQRSLGLQSWTLSLQGYGMAKDKMRCPCDENKTRPYTYVLNDSLAASPAGAPTMDYSRMAKLRSPGLTVLFAEAAATSTGSDHFHWAEYMGQVMPSEVFANDVGVERHGGAANYLFADGHVECLTWKAVQQLLQAPGSSFIDPSSADTTR